MKILITSKWYLTVKNTEEAERAVKDVVEANNETLEGTNAELGVAGTVSWQKTREHKKKIAADPAN